MDRIENSQLRDREIEFRPNEDTMGAIGPNVRLEHCRLILDATKDSFDFLNPCDFLDCRIVAKRRQRDLQSWTSVRLTRCSIMGEFWGNDFGGWPNGTFGAGPDYGFVDDCDFTQATLHACRFIHVDMDKVRLPRWPHFTVLAPRRLAQFADHPSLPQSMRLWAKSMAEEPRETSGVIDHVPALVKEEGCTEADVKRAIELLGQVIT